MTVLCFIHSGIGHMRIIRGHFMKIMDNSLQDDIDYMSEDTWQKLRDALKNISVGEDEYTVTPLSSHKLLGIHVDNTAGRSILHTYVPN